MSYYSFSCPFMLFSKNFSFIYVDCLLVGYIFLPLFFPPSFFHFLSFHLCAKHCSSNMVISIEVCVGFTAGSVVKGEGNGNPLQYFRLEDPMDGGAWQAAVHGVAKSQTRLSNFTHSPCSQQYIYNSQNMEVSKHPLLDEWIKKM